MKKISNFLSFSLYNDYFQIYQHLTPLEKLAALIAAVCHDLDHPGVNQPFLIATDNHLAALYKVMNSKSISWLKINFLSYFEYETKL